MSYLKIKKPTTLFYINYDLFVITSIEFSPMLQPLTILYARRDFSKIVIYQRFCRLQRLYHFIKAENNSIGFEKKKL